MPRIREVMSASSYDPLIHNKFPYYATPKIDGIRFYIQDGMVISRSNKPIPNRFIQQLLPLYLPSGVDGELSYGNHDDPLHFQNTHSCVMSDNNPVDDLRIYLFDYLQPERITSSGALTKALNSLMECIAPDLGEAEVGYADRITYLNKWFKANNQLFIGNEFVDRFKLFSPYQLGTTPRLGHFSELETVIEELTSESMSGKLLQSVHQKTTVLTPTALRQPSHISKYLELCLKQGYEGIMLRSPQGGYKFGRCTPSQDWLLKYKPFTDAEAVIIGFEELLHNDNPTEQTATGRTTRSSSSSGKTKAGTLGAFRVRDVRTGVEFSIGTGQGLTESLRQLVWNRQAYYIHSQIKYNYLSVGTKPDGKPRMPKFLGFRSELDGPIVS